MTTLLELPLPLAKEMCVAILPHMSDDDVTPVIAQAQVTSTYMIASDRFTIGKFDLPDGIRAKEDFYLPRQAVAWLSRINMRNLIGGQAYQHTVRFVKHENANEESRMVRIELVSEIYGVEASQLAIGHMGNFPPVIRLIEDFKPGENVGSFSVAPTFLDRVSRYAKRYKPNHSIRLEFQQDVGVKPKPLRITLDALTVLVQPRLPI